VVLVVFAACVSRDVALPQSEATPSRSLTPSDAGSPTSFVGVITATDVIDVAPRFDGVIAAIHVRAGDSFALGDVLVELDPKPMREQLRAAEAGLAAAHAGRRHADVELEDARRRLVVETKAVADGVSPSIASEEALYAVKRAEAAAQRAASNVAVENSRVQTARDQLSDMVLRAVTSGVVALRFKDPGATVDAGVPILRIISQREPRLRFAVPADVARTLATGAALTVSVDTIAVPIGAILRHVSPAIDPASGMIIVEAELSASADLVELRPGLPARVIL